MPKSRPGCCASGSSTLVLCSVLTCWQWWAQLWSSFFLFFFVSHTVEFKSIRQSRITEGTWRVEIWSLSWVTKGYWRKVWTVTVHQIWQFWLKIGFSASKWLILALAAYCRYEFSTKHYQNVQLNSHNWWNFDHVTASKVWWWKENFVRRVTVMEGCRYDLNSTVLVTIYIIYWFWN